MYKQYKEIRYNRINNRVNGFIILFLTWIYMFVSIVPAITFVEFIFKSLMVFVASGAGLFVLWLCFAIIVSFVCWMFDITF